MSRASGLFITATDTDVGKTVVTAALGCSLQEAGRHIGVLKPVQSGALAAEPAGDTMRLRAWLGLEAAPEEINVYSFEAPLAPLVAARREQAEVRLEPIVERAASLAADCETLLVEGAGGLLVPVGEIWTIADLARALDYPLIVVGRAALGTVNHTLLTVRAARSAGLRVAAVVLNAEGPDCDDPSNTTNGALIEEFGEVPVLGPLPWIEGKVERASIRAQLSPHLDAEQITVLAETAR